MTTNKFATFVICSFILSLGFLGAGYSIGKGMYMVRKANRSITVKGLAEKSVKSDLGIWEITYKEVGNNLTQLDQQLQHDEGIVVNFLKTQGFTTQEVERTPLKVEDRLANVYNNESETTASANQRFVVTSGIRVRSANVDLIQKSMQTTNSLIQQGVPLTFDSSGVSPNPSYYYTNLDTIRPEMLSAATRSATTVAQQFVKDMDVKLGGVQHASQGIFQIMGRDTSTMSSDWNSNENALGSIDKKIRLVTTIEYRLK